MEVPVTQKAFQAESHGDTKSLIIKTLTNQQNWIKVYVVLQIEKINGLQNRVGKESF